MTALKNLVIIYLNRLLKSCFLLTSSGVLALLNPLSAKPLAPDSAAATLEQLGSQWLNQWGRSEINLTGNAPKTLQGGGALLFPWLQGERQLLFTQIGGHFAKTGNLLNTGIGQRWLTDQGHWGYNLFHDCDFKNHYQRLSLGLEGQHNHLSVALNGYQPLTNKKLTVDTSESKTFERTAHGFDLRCQYRLPQHPQLRLNLTGDRYLGEIVHNDSIVHNRSAITVGFDYTPIPFITAGYGFNLDNARNKAHQLQLILTYRLGVPLAEQFDSQPVHIARASLSNRLDLVQHNHQITLEQLIERQEPKAEGNNGGASPQNTPPERTQGPKADPTAEQDLMGYNKPEIADEQPRNTEPRKDAALARQLPNYPDSDAEIATEQQRLKTQAEARENAALARQLPNYSDSDAEMTAEQQRLNAPEYAKESAALEYKAVHAVSTPLNETTPSACGDEISSLSTPLKGRETQETTPYANLSEFPVAFPNLSFNNATDSQWRAEVATAKTQEPAEAHSANGKRKLAAKARDTAAPTVSPIAKLTGSRQRIVTPRIMKPEFQLNNSNTMHDQRQAPTTRPSLPGNNCSVSVQPTHNAWTKPKAGNPTLANKHTLREKTVTPRVSPDSTNTEYGSEYEVIGQINPDDTTESLKNYLTYQKRKQRRQGRTKARDNSVYSGSPVSSYQADAGCQNR